MKLAQAKTCKSALVTFKLSQAVCIPSDLGNLVEYPFSSFITWEDS